MQNYTHQNNHQHVWNVFDSETLLFHFNNAGFTVIEITVAMQPHLVLDIKQLCRGVILNQKDTVLLYSNSCGLTPDAQQACAESI